GSVAGVFLALVGPFDSYQYPLLFRLGFWIPLCLFAALMGGLFEWAVGTSGVFAERRSAHWGVVSAAFTVTMTLVVFLLNARTDDPLADFAMYLQNAAVLCIVFVGARILLGRLIDESGEARGNASQDTGERSVFFGRLSPGLRDAQIYALRAEGHYLQVWTDRGKELVLARMKDAVRELAPVEGIQIHRSWWVAKTAIVGSSRSDGKMEVHLKGNLRAPVSRSNVTKLKSTGWL
ncbi:MAG: LytTR family DNA-binding domain-containing protein, partial [Pseudomonadota bacterium]